MDKTTEYERFTYQDKVYAYLYDEGLIFTIMDDIPKWTIYKGNNWQQVNLETGEHKILDQSLTEAIEEGHWVISPKPVEELIEKVNRALNCDYSQEDYIRKHKESKQ